MIVSDWKDKRLRVGWTIRLANGKLATVTWVNPNGGYTCKVIPTPPAGADSNVKQ